MKLIFFSPNLCFDGPPAGVCWGGTGGDGTGLEETGGQASSQQLIPPTEPHHHFLFFRYKKKTTKRAPKPAIAPRRVPPSVPANRIRDQWTNCSVFQMNVMCVFAFSKQAIRNGFNIGTKVWI